VASARHCSHTSEARSASTAAVTHGQEQPTGQAEGLTAEVGLAAFPLTGQGLGVGSFGAALPHGLDRNQVDHQGTGSGELLEQAACGQLQRAKALCRVVREIRPHLEQNFDFLT
jgi:hypothetical protein